MKVGIVGSCGHNRCVTDVAAKNEDFLLCAVCPGPGETSCDTLLRRVQKSNPEARAYPDYKTLLEEEAPDLLVITAYCGFHGTIALECIRRGIHVFTEKPAATRLEELEELEAAYFSQKQAKLSAMMLSRFSPAFQAAKQALDQGAIGTLRFISAQKSYQFGNRGGMYENPDFYGGTIPWVGSHAADWIRWMSGLEFQAVCAVESRAANRGIGRLETAAVCTFTMEKEVLAVCSLDLFYPEGAKAHGDDRLRMVGSKGVLEVVQGRALLTVPEGQQLLQGPQGKSAFTEFLKDIKGEPSQAVRAREVFSVTRACLLARESAARGERICW